MLIDELAIRNVRVVENARIEPCPTFNVIVGENGSGKTSVLEGIYLAGRGRTFRHPSAGPLIRNGSQSAEVVVRLLDQSTGRRSTVGISRRKQAFEARVNGESVHKRSSLLNCLPLIWIGSQPQELLTTGPETRRGYLDMALFHVEPLAFRTFVGKYQRVLKQRNAALRQGDTIGINSWDNAFIDNALEIDRRRAALVNELMPRIARQLDQWQFGETLSHRYRHGWKSSRSLQEQLSERTERDAIQGFTSVGPHRADLELATPPGSVDKTLSRGQQKMLALAMQFSVMDLVMEKTDRKVVPVLLIDDLSAELDPTNRGLVLESIATKDVQVFLTNIDVNNLPEVPGQRMFHVEHGAVRPLH